MEGMVGYIVLAGGIKGENVDYSFVLVLLLYRH